MKFGMIKPAGSAKYAHEKVAIFRISLFLSIISKFYQICFLKNIRTSMGLITNFIGESCIIVVNKLYNVQETTFFSIIFNNTLSGAECCGVGEKCLRLKKKLLKKIKKRWFPEC